MNPFDPNTVNCVDEVTAAEAERAEDRAASFSFLTDIRAGVAGVVPRVVLSIAAAVGLAAAALLCLGTFSAWTPPLQTFNGGEALLIALAAAGFVWVFALAWIWAPYDRRLRRPVGAGLMLVGVCLACLAICVAVEAMVGPEQARWLLQVGCVLAAITVAILGGLRMGYGPRSDRAVTQRAADVTVHCPRCDYSMKGLTECRCPECGTQYSIDSLIHLQHARSRRGIGPVDGAIGEASEPVDAARPAPRAVPPTEAPDLPGSGLALGGPSA